MKDADSADNKAFLANTPTQAESLLLSLEQVAKGTGVHVNANKKEYMCFKREGATSTLNVGPLKLVDKFTCLSCSILSTESDISMHLMKA